MNNLKEVRKLTPITQSLLICHLKLINVILIEKQRSYFAAAVRNIYTVFVNAVAQLITAIKVDVTRQYLQPGAYRGTGSLMPGPRITGGVEKSQQCCK